MNAQEPSKDAGQGPQNDVNYLKKFLIICLFAVAIPVLLAAPQSQSQSAKAVKSEDEAMREYMVVLSRQLGVTCTSCHDTGNFKKADMKNFKVAKEHMKLTQLLIDNGMDGKKSAKADCYMCHRGQEIPAYKEPLNPMTK